MDDFNVILYFQISHDPDLKWTEARLKSGGRLLTGELTIKPLQPRGGRVDNLKAAIIRMSITVVLSSNWGSTSGEEAGLSGRVDGGFKNVALDLTWTRKKGSCLLCCPASENNVAPALEWKSRETRTQGEEAFAHAHAVTSTVGTSHQVCMLHSVVFISDFKDIRLGPLF